ncbi:hypothetical protein V6N11_011275 [Hibiscus sabdariffa]|uniref:GRF-type domain-containing protein n=1 Tax=Hibiscus sabdariffa TaxID=183260 RepID=A0ABR2S8J7_9ROSI
MEVKGRRETTRISNWHEGMEEPSAFPVCACGFSPQLRTSWSNDKPGRRFFGCKNYGSLVHHGCRYFSWFDPPMTPRARVVMVGLLKRIKVNDIQRRKERFCWVFILVLCVVMIWFIKL